MAKMLDHLMNYDAATYLQQLHVVLAMSGAMLSVYVMSLTSYEREDRVDPHWLQWFRRVGLSLTAFALFLVAGVRISSPAMVLLIGGVNVSMLVRAIAIHLRIRREGGRRVSPQQARGRFPF